MVHEKALVCQQNIICEIFFLVVDHSRVKLTLKTPSQDSDYINANFIKVYISFKSYSAIFNVFLHTNLLNCFKLSKYYTSKRNKNKITALTHFLCTLPSSVLFHKDKEFCHSFLLFTLKTDKHFTHH